MKMIDLNMLAQLSERELIIIGIALVAIIVVIGLSLYLYQLKSKVYNLILANEEQQLELNNTQQLVNSNRDLIQKLQIENANLNTLRASDLENHQKEISLLNSSKEEALKSLRASHEKEIDLIIKSRDEALRAQEKANMESLQAQRKSSQEAIAALERRFGETVEKATFQMKDATAQMLKERQTEFATTSNNNLGQIINPLRETISKMQTAMNDNSEKHSRLCGELNSGLQRMLEQSERAKQSTDELTNALKHGSKVQGDWGEKILDELLQSQGLKAGIHYDLQPVIKDKSGNVIKSEGNKAMRPDVILHLDQNRDVIIDSKVSLTDYIDYVNAEDEVTRRDALARHIRSINNHVKELSNKSYTDYVQPPKICLEYVIMFVPNTGALYTALDASPDLWRKAMEANVYIADQQSLYGALRIVNMMWTQVTQAQNHQKIFSLAEEMLDRVGAFVGEFEKVGQNITKANDAYNKAFNKIKDTGPSIGTTCKKLMELGAKNSNKSTTAKINVEKISGNAQEIELLTNTETIA